MSKTEGIFQFTHWTQYPEPHELWFHWLKERKVPVALVSKWNEKSEVTYHSLWRSRWSESFRGEIIEAKEGRWWPHYVVVKEANGFTEHKNGRG